MSDAPPAGSSLRNGRNVGAEDRFRRRYAVVTLALLLWSSLYEELDETFNLWILGLPLILLPVFGVVIYLFASLISNLIAFRWKRLLSILLGPPVAMLLLIGLLRAGIAPEHGHFLIWRISHLSETDALPRDDRSIHIWPWTIHYGIGITPSFRTIVYDPDGQIMLEPQRRSAEWMRKANLVAEETNAYVRYSIQTSSDEEYKRHVSINYYGSCFYVAEEIGN